MKDYILNDIHLLNLIFKCLYGKPTKEDKEEAYNQVRLLIEEVQNLRRSKNEGMVEK
jgi:hypothetical protein